jgi:hypothetical protein
MEKNKKVENIMRDTRRDIRYIILASRKLTREEMLQIIRLYNYEPMHIKVKKGETVTIESDI